MKFQKQAFTLVEVLVAITIFSIMMISVMGVYMTSTEVTYKADLNRFMQENVKNIVTNLSEDIMEHGVMGAKDNISSVEYDDKSGYFLQTSDNQYKVAKYDLTGALNPTEISKCTPQGGIARPYCYLVVDVNNTLIPITNDLVTVENIKYRITGGENGVPKKVTTFLTLAIAPKSGVREGLVQETKLHTQFTISVRNYKVD